MNGCDPNAAHDRPLNEADLNRPFPSRDVHGNDDVRSGSARFSPPVGPSTAPYPDFSLEKDSKRVDRLPYKTSVKICQSQKQLAREAEEESSRCHWTRPSDNEEIFSIDEVGLLWR